MTLILVPNGEVKIISVTLLSIWSVGISDGRLEVYCSWVLETPGPRRASLPFRRPPPVVGWSRYHCGAVAWSSSTHAIVATPPGNGSAWITPDTCGQISARPSSSVSRYSPSPTALHLTIAQG